jgi:WD40 repeat protein
MVDDKQSLESGIIPQHENRELILPVEMAKRGLELAIKIETHHEIEKPDQPIHRLPGLVHRSCISFSKNCDIAVITSHGKQKDNPGLIIWNTVNKKLRFVVDAKIGDVYSLALSRSGDLILIGYGDGSIGQGKGINGEKLIYKIFSIDPGRSEVTALCVSPDDQTFAECVNANAHIRELKKGKEIQRITGNNEYYNQLTFSDDGRKLVVAHGLGIKGWSRCLTLLDVWGNTTPVVFCPDRIMSISAVAISSDNQILLSMDEGVITVWDAMSAKEVRHWNHTSADVGDVIKEEKQSKYLTIQLKQPII